MEEEDTIIVKWAQEDVETSYKLLNKYGHTNSSFSESRAIHRKITVLNAAISMLYVVVRIVTTKLGRVKISRCVKRRFPIFFLNRNLHKLKPVCLSSLTLRWITPNST